MFVPRRGECSIKHFDTQEELVDYLKGVYSEAYDDPQKHHESLIVATHGRVLKITGDRARHIELPDGTTVELHPGPPIEEPSDPHALLPESWIS